MQGILSSDFIYFIMLSDLLSSRAKQQGIRKGEA